MLISCKCLNFIATSNNQQQRSQEQQQLDANNVGGGNGSTAAAAVATADAKANATLAAVAMQQEEQPHHLDCNISTALCSNNNGSVAAASASNLLVDALKQAFLLRYPRNFVFYSQCIEFFKQAIGPVTDLNINVLSQKDLIYSLTLDLHIENQRSQTWQLSVCSNCSIVLIAKRLGGGPNSQQSYLINCGILTNNEELSQKRSDKSFSDTFGLLIMDHPNRENSAHMHSQMAIGSLSASFATNASNHLDSKQTRLRQLHSNLQQRLQREIAETDERIQRYTEQQFALLKSFREKSEQEYQLLVKLIQCVPEQQANEWLDRQPPNFDLSSNAGNLVYGGSRRRNTISSRRDLNNTVPTTPTTIIPPSNIFGYSNKENVFKNISNNAITPTSPTSAITSTNNTRSALTSAGVTHVVGASVVTSTTPTVVGSSGSGSGSGSNRKISNFDTPPATPEATPMSVGNSPTFRQQQHQNTSFVGQQTFQQQFPTPTIETADDCLFELEGVDGVTSTTGINGSTAFINSSSSTFMQNPPSPIRQQMQQGLHLSHHTLPGYNSYQRTLTFSNQPPDSHHMSDLEESDGAEEAEDALHLDISSTCVPIVVTPQRRININTAANMTNYAKSLPIEIANSPLTTGRSYIPAESEEDELDNNVDIAASIKALAKSVHGEAVFGDLPRPRLRSQI